MANINEETKTVVVKTWDRAYEIVVSYLYSKTPKCVFKIERGTLADGVFNSTPIGVKQVTFNTNDTYPYLHPDTDAVIPDNVFVSLPKHVQLQIQIYSLFMHENCK